MRLSSIDAASRSESERFASEEDHAVSNQRDRRNSQRFPLQLAVKYRPIGGNAKPTWTTGESLNISSTGLRFTTPEAVSPGQGLEVFITWPVALNKLVPLKLAIKGPVVWSDGHQTAMRFERYEFKTRNVELPAM